MNEMRDEDDPFDDDFDFDPDDNENDDYAGMGYTIEVADDGGEIEILCVCGGLLERLTPERLDRHLRSEMKDTHHFGDSFTSTCRKCNEPCTIDFSDIFDAIQNQPERYPKQHQKRWKMLYKHVGEINERHCVSDGNSAVTLERRWLERGTTLICKGTSGKYCNRRIATLENVSPQRAERILNLRYRQSKEISRYTEFARDFTEAVKREDELGTLLSLPCFVSYKLKFSNNYLDDLWCELLPIGEMAASNGQEVDWNDENNYATDAEKITLVGKCPSCGIRHDLAGGERKTIMNRWLKQFEINLQKIAMSPKL